MTDLYDSDNSSSELFDTNSDELFDTNNDEACQALLMVLLNNKKKQRLTCLTSEKRGHDWIQELLNGNPSRIYDCLRMDKSTFLHFCKELKENGGLTSSRNVIIEEQVVIFLRVITHMEDSRDNAEIFQHSTATISKYFTIVLKAVNRFAKMVIRPPNFHEVPTRISENTKFYPYFKDCVGAIDGVHIDACIPIDKQVPFRGRKTTTTQNAMCVCSFEMLFTYVVAGWEGTANDSRILSETSYNGANHFPMPPQGKYYLVDSGYSNIPGFLAPYRGITSHFQEFRRRGGPRGREEFFTYRHSSLRNVIERCFGVLKARFPILKFMHSYNFSKQTWIVIACCAVHNFIRLHAVKDKLFDEFEDDAPEDANPEEVALTKYNNNSTQVRQMAARRDSIANQIWNDHQST